MFCSYVHIRLTQSIFVLFCFTAHQLIPLVACVGFGTGMAGLYIARLALVNPDVTWSRTKNPEPWERYRNKQYKVCMIDNQQFLIKLYDYFGVLSVVCTQHWLLNTGMSCSRLQNGCWTIQINLFGRLC